MAVRWIGEGLLAAGLGLGLPVVLVLVLWITSPYPGSSASDAMRLAADLWLLAHGADLLRADTLSGTAAPIGLTPLLLTALPCWLLHRAVRMAYLPERPPRPGPGVPRSHPYTRTHASSRSPESAVPLDPGAGLLAAAWISTGYLAVGTAAVLCTVQGPLGVRPLSAGLHLPLFTLAVTAGTSWVLGGLPPALTRPVSSLRARLLPCGGAPPGPGHRRRVAATRAAAAATAAFCGVGALLAAGGLLLHAEAAQGAFGQLSASWSGRFAILLLSLALAPNAAVWAASYGLGPGFALGAGSVVAPLGGTGGPQLPQLPAFPLLAGLPAAAPGSPQGWAAAAAVPVTGVLVASWFTARAAAPVRADRSAASGLRETAGTLLLAACGTGLAVGVLAALAGGPLGTRSLADFGPDGPSAALAAAGWTAVLGLPVTLVLRAWRLRRPHLARRLTASTAAAPGRVLRCLLADVPRAAVRALTARLPRRRPRFPRPSWPVRRPRLPARRRPRTDGPHTAPPRQRRRAVLRRTAKRAGDPAAADGTGSTPPS